MRVRHPDAGQGESVDVNGESRPVEDGTFEVDTDESEWLDRWCDANGYDRADVLVADEPTGTCEVVKADGGVCGRDRPCRYHD